jgi:O-antigen ligase
LGAKSSATEIFYAQFFRLKKEKILQAANVGVFDVEGATNTRRRTVFNCAAAIIFFALWFINFSSPPVNNINSTLLQICFVMAVITHFQLPARLQLATVLALFFVASLALSTFSALMLSRPLAQAHGHELSVGVGVVIYIRAAECASAVLFGFAVCRWFFLEAKAAWYVSGAMAAAVQTYFLLLIFYWLSLDQPRLHDWVAGLPLFPNIRHLGHYLCVGMVCSAWGFLAASSRRRWFFLPSFFVTTTLLMWSGGRGAAVAAVMGMVLLLPAFPWSSKARHWRVLLLCMPLALLLSECFVAGTSAALGWLSVFHNAAATHSLEALSSGRISIWRDVVEHITQRPWLGWGGEAFYRLDIRPGMLHAHNGPLQLMLEWGLLGSALLGALMASVLFKGGRQYGAAHTVVAPQTLGLGLGLGVALAGALLILSLVDGVFYFSTTMALLAAALGVVAASTQQHA